MNILVTGGAGFIGSHLCEALLYRKHRVFCIDNFDSFYDPKIKEKNIAPLVNHPGFSLFRYDILNAGELDSVFEQNRIEMVIHLAAKAGVRPSIENPSLYQKVNVEGTTNILEAMRRYSVKKLILASSSSVYGNNKKIPYSEMDNVDFAISPYAATKKACEVLAYTYHHLYGIDTFCLRFFTVYGPRQRPEMAIHNFTRSIIEGSKIKMFGDGSTKRDYTYVDDIIDGIIKCANHCNGFEILNLGESQTTTLKDIILMIEKAVGRKALIEQYPMQPGDVDITFADISKAKEIIGYNPQTKIDAGIKKFVQWYRDTLKPNRPDSE